MRIPSSLTAALMVVAAACVPAHADYPDKPVTLVVSFPAASAVDLAGRYFARVLEEKLGQSFIVENKAGAGGTVGTEAVARARPDGYTILVTTASSITTAAALYKSLPYDPATDFTPIFGINSTGLALNVSGQVPVTSVKEFIEHAKANPGKLSYASAGVGTSAHLAAELFMQRTGTEMVHIPYRGGPPAAVDLLAGNVDLMFVATTTAAANLETGATKVLAVLAPNPAADLPGIPTMIDAGFPELSQAASWFGVFFPKGTDPAMVKVIEDALTEQLATKEAGKQLQAVGLTQLMIPHDRLAAQIVEEIQINKDLVREANIPQQ